MKPIKLKMRGFLTYKNETVIDFRPLYDKKIFIVAGDTGSGKTSIFDAITYALYGDVARDIPADKLRSDFLSADDLYSYVDFTFMVDGKTYQLERIPNQLAKKSRKGQNISHSVTLYDLTTEKTLLADKVNAANNKLAEIIGLSKDQFSKVMLLAQGEFQKFLHAGSDERKKLLGDIFKTAAYKDMQDKLKEEAADVSKNIELIDQSLEMAASRYADLSELIVREDILSHNFDNIIKAVKAYRDDIKKSYEEINYTHTEKTNLQKEKITYLESAKALNENIKRYTELKADLDKKLVHKEKYTSLKEKLLKARAANEIALYEERYEDLKADLTAETTRLENLEASKETLAKSLEEVSISYEGLAGKSESLSKLNIALSEDKKLLADLEEFIKSKEAYEKLTGIENEIRELKGSLESDKETIENQRLAREEINTNKNGMVEKKLGLARETLEISTCIKDLKADLAKANKNLEYKKLIEENNEKIEDLKKYQENLEKDLLNYKNELKNQELNKLIDELNKTGICPVCGSKHESELKKHPVTDIITDPSAKIVDLKAEISALESQNNFYLENLADVADKAVLEEKIKDLDRKLESVRAEEKSLDTETSKLNDKLNEKSLEIDQSQKTIEANENKLRSLMAKENDLNDLKIAYESARGKFANLSAEALTEKISQSEKEITELSSYIEEVRANYNQLTNEETKNKAKIAASNDTIKKLKTSIKNAEEDFSNKRIASFNNQAAYIKAKESFTDLITQEEEIITYFKDLEKSQTLEENYRDYAKKELIDTAIITAEINSLSEEIKELTEKINALSIKLANAKQTLTELNDLGLAYESQKSEAEMLSKLAKIADGSIGAVAGREKIDFESFVLSYYFDKVLAYANKRLLAMSNGQFTMRRSEGLDQRKKWGLDIEILDANTGKARPASTLSGGESFLASLSLALGLSDEISAENGGITIDTLFIDEGFGTLSDDYLSKVIEQIEKLSYENKFIGLISHVKELKDAIDSKILVTYTSDEGSFVEVRA